MKGYSKLANDEATDVAPKTEISLKDVTATEEPTTFREGTVSVAWKRAFFVLLALVIFAGGACVLRGHPPPHGDDDDHFGVHRKMGPWGMGHDGHHMKSHDGHHMKGHNDGHHMKDHDDDAAHDDSKSDGFDTEVDANAEHKWAAGASSIFNWATKMFGISEDSDDAADCKQAFVALEKRCAMAIEEVKKAVKDGKMKPEEAREKVESIEKACKARGEALAKKCGGKAARCKIAFKELKSGCAATLKEIKEAADAGKITPEVARKKVALVEKACKAKAEALKKRCGAAEEEDADDAPQPVKPEAEA